MMLFSVQSRQMLDGLLLLFGFGFFFIKQKNLTEYYENSFNANIDCSTYLTSKEKARKLDRTTHLNQEWNNPSFYNGAVYEKVFR